MAWLFFLGLVEFVVFGAALGLIVIPAWEAISPYWIDPHRLYIPPWGFWALRAAVATVVPLLVGWDMARRSKGREMAAGVALVFLFAALNAGSVFRSGTLVHHLNDFPYNGVENYLTLFCAEALFATAGAILYRYRAVRTGRTFVESAPPGRNLFLSVLASALIMLVLTFLFLNHPPR
jgi:hypothetical protein